MTWLYAGLIAVVVSPPLADAVEAVTASDAILCLRAENVGAANNSKIAQSQVVLKAMGCLRSEAGIRSLVLDKTGSEAPVRVVFYPAGISGGVLLWALPSALVNLNAPRQPVPHAPDTPVLELLGRE
jgi:hypothetical protein